MLRRNDRGIGNTYNHSQAVPTVREQKINGWFVIPSQADILRLCHSGCDVASGRIVTLGALQLMDPQRRGLARQLLRLGNLCEIVGFGVVGLTILV